MSTDFTEFLVKYYQQTTPNHASKFEGHGTDFTGLYLVFIGFRLGLKSVAPVLPGFT